MSKHTITINPICIPDGFNLGEIIYEKLNEVSGDWIYSTETISNDRHDYIVRKSKKNPEYGYGFRVDKWIGGATGGIGICPTLVSFSNDTTILLRSFWTPSIYGSKNDPVYPDRVQSDLTIFIGKQQKCYSVSVTPHDSGYTLMNAICGEDTSDDPYIFYPGIRPDGDGKAMSFASFKLDDSVPLTESWANTAYTSNNYPADQGIGLIDNNQKIVMAPFVNPCAGTICPDLYMPICGPMSTYIYDVQISSRKFCTGSSSAPASMGGLLTNNEYQAWYKVFMEV